MEGPMSDSFLIFLIYRISSVFFIQTFYVPDEYWQSLEVAHKMAFGYGYLTWEWRNGLRSYLYPSFFAFVYKCLELLHLDCPHLIILFPKLLQAFLTALSDQHFVLLCKNLGFDNFWAKIYVVTNWFWYYCGSRTLANTFETSLTAIALYYYPWNLFIKNAKGKYKNSHETEHEMISKSQKYMTLSAVSCIVRPTAVTIWGPLVVFHLVSLSREKLKCIIARCVLPVFFCALSGSILIDFVWYGEVVVPAYNFFIFNIVKNVSSFYGTHPYYWYLTQGLPVILGLHVFPVLLGLKSFIRKLLKRKNDLHFEVFAIWIFIIVFNVLILSTVPHKEFRFLLPLLPFMTLIAIKETSDYKTSYKMFWVCLLFCSFTLFIGLFGFVHQRAPLQLMKYLSKATLNCGPNCSFLFLLPCHSTPLYSHLHVNISTKFLTCDPPITDNSWDESEFFFNNPIQWLVDNWDDLKPPTHVAFFESMIPSVGPYLRARNFIQVISFLHTPFTEKKTERYIVVYEQQ